MRRFETVLKFAPTSEGGDEYVMSDGKPDRSEEVIEPAGWVISDLIPALFNHIKTEVIGHWENVRVVGRQLVGRLMLADEGTSPTVNMVRALIRQGHLDGVSVGFRPIKKEPLDARDPFWGPQRYLKSELLECSLVAVAANPRARRIVKEFLPDGDRLLALPHVIRHRITSSEKGARPMKLSERIVQNERTIVAIDDKLKALADKIEASDDDLSDADSEEMETLQVEKSDAQRQLERFKALETDIAGRIPRDRDDDLREIVIRRGSDNAIRQAVRNASGFDLLVRAALCNFYSYVERQPPEAVLRDRYSKHRSFRELEVVLKATSAPAMTSVVGWAAELVGANVAALLAAIEPVSIFPRLLARGTSFTFDGQVPIVVPSRQYGTVPGGASPTDRNKRLSGAFVGEGSPIPVRQGLFKSITLSPYKLGVISTFTREMAMASTPAMEQIIREAIAEDTAWALDMALLSAQSAIANVRPAGIFNGVVALTPAAAGPNAALTDLTALLSAVIGAGGGRSIVFIMNPIQALALGLMHEGGVFLFRQELASGQLLTYGVITSITVPAREVYCIDAADFASGTGAPIFDVSDQATLHMDDGTYPPDFTAPSTKPIVGAATPPPALADIATPQRSLWQTASIGVRMIMWTSWAMRRAGMVSLVQGVNW